MCVQKKKKRIKTKSKSSSDFLIDKVTEQARARGGPFVDMMDFRCDNKIVSENIQFENSADQIAREGGGGD